MRPVSPEEYERMLQDDRDWANRLVQAVKDDPRKYVKYRDPRPITSIKNMIETSAEMFPDHIAFYTKFEKGPYKTITFKEYMADINALGTQLIAMGLKENRIAIIGDTNYTWSVSDMAVVCGTGCAVPLDKELPYDDLKNLIKESEATAVLFDKKREPIFTRMMAEGETPLRFLIAQQEHEERTVEVTLEDGTKTSVQVLSFWKLLEAGKALVAGGDRSFIDAQIDSRETSIIIFTSGTTGMAKGIMLSHRNICADLIISPTVLLVTDHEIFFSMLPIHHTYEYTSDFLMPHFKGSAVAHCEGLKYILKNIQEVHPTFFLGVPAVFETLHKQIWKGIRAKGKEAVAKKGVKISLFFRNKLHMDVSNLFFKEIKEQFGGRFRMFIAGGAAINPAILEDFQAFGIQALQGYGLSECAPMGALNPDTCPKAASIGVAFPGCGARIDEPNEDGIGEICLRGENVMLGYYKRPDLTAEVIRDGWLHTGDLGYIDKEGYIYITGRAKNVIITKNGKNVFPEELEYELSLHDCINESMVFEAESENKDDTVIAASIYPDWEVVKAALGEGAEDTAKVEEYLWKAVNETNAKNPTYKMIKQIFVRHTPLEKNTSNKVVRFRPGNKQGN
ncbi:MAG: AMP-binding protein [Firmicutes bacterium]|nr:AMP-binding protein [Bacillota bacterium]MBQ2042762.1 AMP-binding protein [Bacillota bacterium]